jgi:hypothetical protein
MNICKYIVMSLSFNTNRPINKDIAKSINHVASSSTPAQASAPSASSSGINFLAFVSPGMGLNPTFFSSFGQSAPGQAIANISEKFDAMNGPANAARDRAAIEGSEKTAKAMAEGIAALAKAMGDLINGIAKGIESSNSSNA